MHTNLEQVGRFIVTASWGNKRRMKSRIKSKGFLILVIHMGYSYGIQMWRIFSTDVMGGRGVCCVVHLYVTLTCLCRIN